MEMNLKGQHKWMADKVQHFTLNRYVELSTLPNQLHVVDVGQYLMLEQGVNAPGDGHDLSRCNGTFNLTTDRLVQAIDYVLTEESSVLFFRVGRTRLLFNLDGDLMGFVCIMALEDLYVAVADYGDEFLNSLKLRLAELHKK